MAERVVWQGSAEGLRALLRSVPALFAGHAPDPFGLARKMQLRLGVALLSKVQQAFIVKARGGVGEDGIRWLPLSRKTVAQRRVTGAEKKTAGVTGKRTRGLLTPAQASRWRTLFARTKAGLMAKFGLDETTASARAAALAWATLKREGAKTKLDVFGGRQVEALRDTGELLRSFSPGVDDRPSGAEGQVFEVPPGRVIVGTNKKTWHHRGVPGRLPARPFWPNEMPRRWAEALTGTLRRGLVRAVVLLATRGRAS